MTLRVEIMRPGFTLFQTVSTSSEFFLCKMGVAWEHWEANFKSVRHLPNIVI